MRFDEARRLVDDDGTTVAVVDTSSLSS